MYYMICKVNRLKELSTQSFLTDKGRLEGLTFEICLLWEQGLILLLIQFDVNYKKWHIWAVKGGLSDLACSYTCCWREIMTQRSFYCGIFILYYVNNQKCGNFIILCLYTQKQKEINTCSSQYLENVISGFVDI